MRPPGRTTPRELGDGARRLRHEHQAEPARRAVEGGVGERQPVGAALVGVDVVDAVGGGDASGRGEHSGRQVGEHNVPVRCQLGDGEPGLPSAGSDVEVALIGSDPKASDHCHADRPEHLLNDVVPAFPAGGESLPGLPLGGFDLDVEWCAHVLATSLVVAA